MTVNFPKQMIWVMVALVWLGTSAQADIFRWTDENGVVHFSNNPTHPGGELYLKEEAGPPPDLSADREAEELQAQLEEANQMLEATLEKVDTLNERVAEAESEVRRVKQAAKQQPPLTGETTADPRDTQKKRNVYYYPYPAYSNHKPFYPRQWKHKHKPHGTKHHGYHDRRYRHPRYRGEKHISAHPRKRVPFALPRKSALPRQRINERHHQLFETPSPF